MHFGSDMSLSGLWTRIGSVSETTDYYVRFQIGFNFPRTKYIACLFASDYRDKTNYNILRNIKFRSRFLVDLISAHKKCLNSGSINK